MAFTPEWTCFQSPACRRNLSVRGPYPNSGKCPCGAVYRVRSLGHDDYIVELRRTPGVGVQAIQCPSCALNIIIAHVPLYAIIVRPGEQLSGGLLAHRCDRCQTPIPILTSAEAVGPGLIPGHIVKGDGTVVS